MPGSVIELAVFINERSIATDVLAYADQTVGPKGRVMTFEDRLADMLRRHGPDSAQAGYRATRPLV